MASLITSFKNILYILTNMQMIYGETARRLHLNSFIPKIPTRRDDKERLI